MPDHPDEYRRHAEVPQAYIHVPGVSVGDHQISLCSVFCSPLERQRPNFRVGRARSVILRQQL